MMTDLKKTVRDFLYRYGMYYESLDAKKALKDFTKEMEQGLARSEPCSLQMIPSYIYETSGIKSGSQVIAVDIGGTHVRVAEIRFLPDGTPKIMTISRYETPGTKRPVSRDEFFQEIARDLEPVVHEGSLIGCCFSFAIQPEKNGDAVVVASGKQLMVSDLIGAEVGENLRSALAADGISGVKIIVLNDAVAVLLGGVRTVPGRHFDGAIGFIYGTGTNISYFEKGERIPGCASGRKMLINVESCGYNGFSRGKIDVEFDKKLSDFGLDQYEKMVAGKYQGPLLLEILRTAVQDGLFSSDFAACLNGVKHLPSKELDEFLLQPYGRGMLASCCDRGKSTGHDRTILYYIIDALFERSALLCAVVLGAVMCKSGSGRDPCSPSYVVAEGSTFYGSRRFRSKLDFYVSSFLQKEVGVYPEFFSAEEATLTGAAAAALDFEI
jgi:hexokinase